MPAVLLPGELLPAELLAAGLLPAVLLAAGLLTVLLLTADVVVAYVVVDGVVVVLSWVGSERRMGRLRVLPLHRLAPFRGHTDCTGIKAQDRKLHFGKPPALPTPL